MLSVAHMPFLVQAGTLALIAFGFLAFLAIVALRFARRGAARFWAAPGALALALLPAVLAAGLTALSFRHVLDGMALVGSGGVAALAAGSAEALIPLLVGLASVAALAFVGLLLMCVGSSRVAEGGSGGGPGLAGAALVALFLSAGLIVLSVQVVATVNGGLRDPQGLLLRVNGSLVGSAVLATLLLVLVLVTALRAPRGAAPLGVKLASLAAFPLCGLLALAGLWVVHSHIQSYTRTALTGEREDAGPVRGAADTGSQEAGEGRGVDKDGLPVGGHIKEPTKLKNVPPEYPEIAKQAGVQGVVILECTIGPTGKVTQVKVLRGVPLLDEAAIDAVKQWVYAPTLLNGVPVPVTMTVTVNFRLS